MKQRFEKGINNEGDVRRTEVEARCAELGNIKNAFEQGKFQRSEEVSAVAYA